MKYTGKTIRVVAAEISRNGAYLITQRAPKAVLPLLWEFPGGRVEAGESDVQALRREIVEKFGIDATVGDMTLEVTHEYVEYTVNLRVYRCSVPTCEFPQAEVHAWRWVTPDQFDQYEFPGADQETIDQLVRSML
jgi:8-oxo-dGTP diphosphatase